MRSYRCPQERCGAHVRGRSLESGIPGFEFLLRHLEAEGLGASCWTPLGLVSPV